LFSITLRNFEMANTVTKLGGFIDISALTGDWVLSDTFDVPSGVYVGDIKLFPADGVTGNRLVVRHGSVAGPVISVLKSVAGDGQKDSIEMENVIPCIKLSECTLTAGFHICFTGKSGVLF
jgi:hypothetical protein